jgi:hypothetical protein
VSVGCAAQSYTFLGMLRSVGQMLGNFLLPSLLGGVSRKYVQVTAVANLTGMERLAAMAAAGKLKVPIDSHWEMEDALKVSSRNEG